jgi:glycolate oxidase FAD binding subunit
VSQSTVFPHLQTPHTLLGVGKQNAHAWASVRVETSQALAQLLEECSRARIKVMTGAQRALPDDDSGDACGYVFVDMRQINRVTEHRRRDQVISVETGITLDELDSLLQQNGQWWPVSSAGGSTVYDVIQTGDGGCLEHGFGGPRHLILGLEAILPTGRTIKSGGKVVKNVTGYDMTKLFVGARGTLSLPYLAHLRLFARPQSSVSLLIAADKDVLSLLHHANKLMSSGLPIAVLELFRPDLLPETTETSSMRKRMPAAAHRLVMLVQIFENEKVIAEILPQVQAMAAPDLVQSQLSHDTAQQLIGKISSVPPRYYELSCAPSVMAQLLAENPAVLNADGLQLRPGAGRLRFISNENSSPIQQLRIWSKRRDCAFTGAQVDEDRYTVQRYPQEDAAADEIIQSLQRQFDPDACLNPFARFEGGSGIRRSQENPHD